MSIAVYHGKESEEINTTNNDLYPAMIQQKRAYTTAYKLVFVSYGGLIYSFQLAAFFLSVTNVR